MQCINISNENEYTFTHMHTHIHKKTDGTTKANETKQNKSTARTKTNREKHNDKEELDHVFGWVCVRVWWFPCSWNHFISIGCFGPSFMALHTFLSRLSSAIISNSCLRPTISIFHGNCEAVNSSFVCSSSFFILMFMSWSCCLVWRRSLGVLKHWTSHYWFHDHKSNFDI